VTRDPDLWPSDPKINALPGLIVEHFYVKFSDPSCIVFLRYRAKKTNRHTDKPRRNTTPLLPSSWVIAIVSDYVFRHHNDSLQV